MSVSPVSKTHPGGCAYELLPSGLPVASPPGVSDEDGTDTNQGSTTPLPPANAKLDPRWARRASLQLMDTRGVAVVDTQRVVAELRKTQAAVKGSLGETRDAVLWLQKLEVLERQLVLVPKYRERAGKIVADMQNIAARVVKAKKRASALSGTSFPEWEDEDGEGG